MTTSLHRLTAHPRPARLLVAGAVLCALPACAGPREPLSVGARQVDTDILLGTAPAVVEDALPPALPPAGIPQVGGPVFQLPPQVGTGAPPPAVVELPSAPPAPDRCPDNNDDPRLRSDNAGPVGAPAPGTYVFRTEGTFERSGADATKGVIDTQASTQVANVRAGVAGYYYDAATVIGDATTTVTYFVLPRGSTVAGQEPYVGPPPPANVGANVPGMYIARIQTRDKGVVRDFTPATLLKIFEWAGATGTQFAVSGSDDDETMSFVATIGQGRHVNACGTPLDALTVQLSEGRYVWRYKDTAGTEQQVVSDFSATYGIATQYGALIIASDYQRRTKAVSGADVEFLELETEINAEPAKVTPFPKGPVQP